MRPFALTSMLLLLTASSLAAPLSSRDTPVLAAGCALLQQPGNASALATPTSTTTDPKPKTNLSSHPKLPKFKASASTNWITSLISRHRKVSHLDPKSKSSSVAATSNTTAANSTAVAGDGDKSLRVGYDGLARMLAASRYSWISWRGKKLKSRQAAGNSTTVAEDGGDGLAVGLDGLARMGAASSHSWISWPGKKLKSRQAAGNSTTVAEDGGDGLTVGLDGLARMGAASSHSWISWPGRS